VEEIVKNHWRTYGRNYYSRYDYEGVASLAANAVINHLRASFDTLPDMKFGEFTVRYCHYQCRTVHNPTNCSKIPSLHCSSFYSN
jgi:phosphoglucomutase